jgi:Kef-type K+ transport system membrane component KefB
MAGGGGGNGSLFPKIITIAILFGMAAGIQALLEPPEGTINPASMATLGFIILAAYTTADVAERVHLPHITGYLLTGLACGPYFLELLNEGVVKDLQLFNALAVALIALAAGGALRLDMLRSGARVVASVLFSQFAVVVPVITGLLLLLSGYIPNFAVPFLDGVPVVEALACAMVLGVVASAQSPAASIAIIEGNRARGPVSDAVLGVSVLNNVVVVVLFAGAMAVAGGLAPELMGGHGGGHESSLVANLTREVGGAGVIGVALGFLIAAYIRFVNQELLLVVAALSFTVTWAARELGINEVLAFLAAGFVVRNYTSAGEDLSRAVSTLALPVYVIFFFIAGAGIHVDALEKMWPFALLIFAARMGSLYLGTLGGVRLSRGPESLSRVGWMGFGAQAGIALSMAIEVGHSVDGVGLDMETLAVAGIALNEMFGPVLLQFSLGLAGEIPRDKPQQTPEEAGEEVEDDPSEMLTGVLSLPQWIPEAGYASFDPWGPLPEVDSRRIIEVARQLRGDLQVLLRDLRAGPVATRRESAHTWLTLIRREFLRFHRSARVLAKRDDLGCAARVEAMRREQSQLARRWESHLLDRAATVDFRPDSDALERLLTALDRIAEHLPQDIEVPVEEARFLRDEGDGAWLRLSRSRMRLARRVTREPLTRKVDARALARFYFSGHVPGHLHGAAGLLTLTERHLVTRARALFEVIERALEPTLSKPAFESEQETAEERVALLDSLREELEEEFDLAHQEVDRLADETVRAAAAGLGRAWRELCVGLTLAGTPELPARRYRLSRVYDKRQKDTELMGERLSQARELTRGVAGGLAMELELVRLSDRIRVLIDDRVDELSRELRGRVALQMRRVNEALEKTLGALRAHLDSEEQAPALREAVREAAAPLTHVTEDALGIAETLRNGLKTESLLEPLRAGLDAGIDELTDRFLVSTLRPESLTGRGLPPAPENQSFEFRAAVRRYLESEINRDLAEVIHWLLDPVQGAIQGLEELQRSLAINTELSLTELDVAADEELSATARAVVRDSLVNVLLRMRDRLARLERHAQEAAGEVGEQLHSAVLHNLEQLHAMVVEGRWGELRMRAAQGSLRRRRELISGGLSNLPALRTSAEDLARRLIGEENAHRIREILGLPDDEDTPLGPRIFSAAAERVEFPVAFRRLFADTRLEAGDLLTGREHEVEKVRRILLGEEPGTSRAVAVVGVGGIGQSAVVGALVRGLGERLPVVRHTLDRPVNTVAQVDEMLARSGDGVVIVDGLHWLFDIRPGGFDPLRHFLKRVLEDGGKRAWVVSAQRPVWTYADRVVPLGDVFPHRVDLHTLGVEELQRAVLARHRLSGFGVRFIRPEGHPSIWIKEALTRESREEGIYERFFFQRLHEATDGVLSDALRLWMASIQGIEQGQDVMLVGDVPATTLRYMRRLPDEALMTLRQVARQGRLTVEGHAIQFRVDRAESEALLSRMAHWGLLVFDPLGFYAFSPWLTGTLYRVLRERRLVG